MSSTEPTTSAGLVVFTSTPPTATRSPGERTIKVGSATLPVVDLIRQAALLSLAALAYFGVRAITKSDKALAIAHAEAIISFERRFHLLVEGSLQGLIIDNHSLVTAANWYYIFGHWPVILVAFVWLYTRHRNVYRRLRNAMFVSGAIGLVIFWFYPVAPPRLTDPGLVDTVTKYSHAYRVLQPPAIEDRFASLPSLHVGWNLLVGLTLARTIRNRIGQVVAALSPLAMAVAVVVTANHFVVDVLLGGVVALVGFRVGEWIPERSVHSPERTTPMTTTADKGARLEEIPVSTELRAVRPAAIDAVEVSKTFGKQLVLDSVSLSVEAGSVYGLLGPNGAGKTTLIRILSTLLPPSSGRATVAGVDVRDDPAGVRATIGLAGQFAAVDGYQTGRENLVMVGRLYNLRRREAARRADDVLERIRLGEAGDQLIRTYSGGMRRRLDLAASLVGRPPVLFLDEPTTGIDPRSRIDVWELITEMVEDDGTTVLLTTQYLDEAERLADRIGVIDLGRLIAEGTADELKQQFGGDRIELVVEADQIDRFLSALDWTPGDTAIDRRRGLIWRPAPGGPDELSKALDRLMVAGLTPVTIALRKPSLDDVFLTLTTSDDEEHR